MRLRGFYHRYERSLISYIHELSDTAGKLFLNNVETRGTDDMFHKIRDISIATKESKSSRTCDG